MTADLELSVPSPSNPAVVDTSRLSWATSLFYFGMLAGLYPMSYALQRFETGRTLGAVVCTWALVCLLTASVTTYRGLYAQRFFLGFIESVIPTGFMTIVSGCYTQREQSLRQSWWFSSTGWWTIIGGALNYGFAQITGGGLQRWQYIYLLAGSLTFLFGLFCFAIPSSPVTAWFLTEEEKFAAVERLRLGQTGIRCSQFKGAQLREALLDVKIWLIFIMMASAYTVNGAVSGFGPLIVSVSRNFTSVLYSQKSAFNVTDSESDLWLEHAAVDCISVPTRRSLPHLDSVDWMARIAVRKYPHHYAHCLLPARHCRLRTDMEKRMVLSRRGTSRGILHYRHIWRSRQSHHYHWHVECRRQHQEELHFGHHLCGILCW